jgi:hypothetical protein
MYPFVFVVGLACYSTALIPVHGMPCTRSIPYLLCAPEDLFHALNQMFPQKALTVAGRWGSIAKEGGVCSFCGSLSCNKRCQERDPSTLMKKYLMHVAVGDCTDANVPFQGARASCEQWVLGSSKTYQQVPSGVYQPLTAELQLRASSACG